MEADLAAVSELVQSADLPFDARRTVLWCLGHLAPALGHLLRTYESRYAEEVQRLERALVKLIDETNAPAGEAVRQRLRVMHEDLGLPAPSWPPLVTLPKPRKKSA